MVEGAMNALWHGLSSATRVRAARLNSVFAIGVFVAKLTVAQPRFIESVEAVDSSTRLEVRASFTSPVAPSELLVLAVSSNYGDPASLAVEVDAPAVQTPLVTSTGPAPFSGIWVRLVGVFGVDGGIRSTSCRLDGGQPAGSMGDIQCIWLRYSERGGFSVRDMRAYQSEVSTADAGVFDAGTLRTESGDLVLMYVFASNIALPLSPSPWTIRSTLRGDLMVESFSTQSEPLTLAYSAARTAQAELWTTAAAVALNLRTQPADGGVPDAGGTMSNADAGAANDGGDPDAGGTTSNADAGIANDGGAPDAGRVVDGGGPDAGGTNASVDAGQANDDAGSWPVANPTDSPPPDTEATRYRLGCASLESLWVVAAIVACFPLRTRSSRRRTM
jgi:hypothetical protein